MNMEWKLSPLPDLLGGDADHRIVFHGRDVLTRYP